MKKAILSMYNALITVSMALIIICGTAAGSAKGFIGAIIGFGISFVIVSIFFGLILIFIDMQESLQAIRKSLDKNG